MTKGLLLSLFLLSFIPHGHAQSLISFDFISEEENRLIKETDSFKYYVSAGDSSNTVVLEEEGLYYKLLNKNQKVIAEGSYMAEAEKYLQTGKWIERYDNGKTKIMGCYIKNKPVGTWQENFSSGKTKAIYNYALIVSEWGTTYYCMSGSWQEFYANGKIKETGYYTAKEVKVTDTISVDDPVTDQKITKLITRSEYTPLKTGIWEYYSESGELDKREEL